MEVHLPDALLLRILRYSSQGYLHGCSLVHEVLPVRSERILHWNNEVPALRSENERKSLRLLGAVNRLASDYVAVYSVNRQQKTISVYRSEFTNDPDNSIVKDNADYDTVREYLTRYIHPDDRSYVLKKMELDYLEQKLANSSSFRVHFSAVVIRWS